MRKTVFTLGLFCSLLLSACKAPQSYMETVIYKPSLPAELKETIAEDKEECLEQGHHFAVNKAIAKIRHEHSPFTYYVIDKGLYTCAGSKKCFTRTNAGRYIEIIVYKDRQTQPYARFEELAVEWELAPHRKNFETPADLIFKVIIHPKSNLEERIYAFSDLHRSYQPQ